MPVLILIVTLIFGFFLIHFLNDKRDALKTCEKDKNKNCATCTGTCARKLF